MAEEYSVSNLPPFQDMQGGQELPSVPLTHEEVAAAIRELLERVTALESETEDLNNEIIPLRDTVEEHDLSISMMEEAE